MNKLRFQPEAVSQIKEALHNYEIINPDLGEAFKEELRAGFQILRDNPVLWRLRYKTIRIALLKRFPYSIHYTVNEDITSVFEVLHQR